MRAAIRIVLALLTVAAVVNLAYGPRLRAKAAPVTAAGCAARTMP